MPTQPAAPDSAAQAATSVDPSDLAEAATSLDPGGLAEAATSMAPSADSAISGAARGSKPSSPHPSSDPQSDADRHGRFLPGSIVAERYRIVGLLGRGGMGEVYRADDLKLGQQVALKFLSREVSAAEMQVQMLLDEVRTARKVSHRNVCRVWDVGEAEGQHYVSMEYVDGEDLASLLRRIGRLPEDKAVEIARQLCAALAAAHDEGVLHRDLKPANIMLDGRGRVKLTDFGLAAVAEVRAGTPVYMAPEQLEGKEVSVRSDIYSLGLVLHELLTGRRVFEADSFDELSRLHKSSMTTSLTRTGGLDPAVDRIIHRCLENDPAKRPASALAVAAGLPGADPLAAALAAGETPSPEMVAEAGGEGTLPVLVALPLLLVALLGTIAVGVVQANGSLVGWVPFDRPPQVLEARAEEIVGDLGYETDGADKASGFSSDLSYIRWLRSEDAPPERWDTIAGGRPEVIHFWWRSSPSTLIPNALTGPSTNVAVSLTNPPRTTPGMISLQLDTLGRLVWFDAVPARVAETREAGEVDWQRLFERMGLEMGDFTAVEPRYSPDHFADRRAAWEGSYPEDPESSLRIEAAALDGRLVSLRLFSDWAPLEPAAPSAATATSRLTLAAIIAVLLAVSIMILTVIFGGLYVAQRNVRTGRGDTRGARRLGFAIALAAALTWVLGEHTYTPNDINEFMDMLVFVGAAGGLTWALYLAVEPFMRRHAPEALIGWTRVVDGRLSDPLVGRDILLGCAIGALMRLLDVLPLAVQERSVTAGTYVGLPLRSLTKVLQTFIGGAIGAVIVALGVSFLYGLTFVALRRRRGLTYAVWLFFLGGIGFIPGLTLNASRPSASLLTEILWVVGIALWLFVLFRLGLLVFIAMTTSAALMISTLPTLDFSAWYSSSIVAGLAIVFALAAYAFYRCVAWRGGLAEALISD
ncbi:MAG: serine/threonine-protein kinase [Acidobacteriota bacterium]|jgi:serine/threonine-protein kinase